jgi:hypothetical protein
MPQEDVAWEIMAAIWFLVRALGIPFITSMSRRLMG